MSATTSNELILSKLTVPKLKALCKEKKVSGYSKLGKQALIQKLVEAGYTPDDSPVSASPASAVQIPASRQATSVTRSTDSLPIAKPCDSSTSASAPGAVSNKQAKLRHSSPKAKLKGRKKALCVGPSAITGDDVTAVLLPGAVGPVHIVSATASTSNGNGTLGFTDQSSSVSAAGIGSGSTDVDGASLPCGSPGQFPGRSVPASHSRTGISGTLVVSPPSAHQVLAQGKKRPHDGEKDMLPPPASANPRIQPLTARHLASSTSGSISVRSTSHPHGPISADVSRPVVAPTTRTRGPVSAVTSSLPPAKRFKPLIVDKAKCAAAAANSANSEALAPITSSTNAPEVLHYLDFPMSDSPLPTLRSITLPPPLAQRKRVARWAVILSGLSDKERAVCILVSRTFRYAVYLSASSILSRYYDGRRLQQDVFRAYPQAMTDMWPYLRLREAEVAERRRMYEASFLPPFFRRCGMTNPIAAHLWASPDDSRQIAIALRFALTRVWFELSLGSSDGSKSDPRSWLRGTIIDVQEVVRGDVWSVTIQHPRTAAQAGARETLHVLESTCEVVGRSEREGRDGGELKDPSSVEIRADWSAYIANCSAPSSDAASLLSRVKWPCREEFMQGISKIWLKRIAGEGNLGQAKLAVAERYVLASVVGNSISGRWMTASAMAQEFAGLTARVAPIASGSSKAPSLNLYLPEHHHVESVHFATARGERLHAALAAVQTPHREYYILRDNGMQVGCEEEGVAKVWQEVLGCDERGRPTC